MMETDTLGFGVTKEDFAASKEKQLQAMGYKKKIHDKRESKLEKTEEKSV